MKLMAELLDGYSIIFIKIKILHVLSRVLICMKLIYLYAEELNKL